MARHDSKFARDAATTAKHGMFEERLRNFFADAGSLHATHILQNLPHNVPLMKQYPEIAAAELHRLRKFITTAPSHNFIPGIQILHVIAEQVPELRDQIVQEMGDALYKYKALPDLPGSGTLSSLLETLEMPVTSRDDRLRELARALVSLNQSAILVVGAGFSYDSMPITTELTSLLVPVLRNEGVENPAEMLEKNEQEAWRIVASQKQEFQRRFVGWSARSKPSFQHEMACELIDAGQITHLISFNWDDLLERAHSSRFDKSIPKVAQDGTLLDEPGLWKLHGDVEDPAAEWVFPYEPGRVFDSLMESLERAQSERSPSHALIVGYGEWEPEVNEKLVSWLEQNVPDVLRVRPNWPPDDERGIADSAKRFFQRLDIYMKLEGRDGS